MEHPDPQYRDLMIILKTGLSLPLPRRHPFETGRPHEQHRNYMIRAQQRLLSKTVTLPLLLQCHHDLRGGTHHSLSLLDDLLTTCPRGQTLSRPGRDNPIVRCLSVIQNMHHTVDMTLGYHRTIMVD